MIWKYGWKELRQSIPIYAVAVLQTALILVALFCTATASEARYQFLKPLRPFLDQDGVACYFFGVAPADAKQLEAELHGDAKVSMSSVLWYDDIKHNFRMYDDSIADAYTPEMKSGVWMKRSDDPQTVCAVAYESSGFVLGESEEIQTPAGRMNLCITGILEDTEKVIGYNQHFAQMNDYRLLYTSAEINDNRIMLFLPGSEAEKMKAQQLSNGIAFIRFGRERSEKEETDNMEILSRFNPVYIADNALLRKNSYDYIFEQLHLLLPVIAGATVLLLISLICSNAVFANRRRKTYSVYVVLGFTRTKCMGISAARSLILMIGALLTAGIILLLMPMLSPFRNVLVRFSIWHIPIVLVMLLLHIATAICTTGLVLGREPDLRLFD